MNLYLTGSTVSPATGGAPQTDVSKSLGGFISNSPVPNGQLNALFSDVSTKGKNDPQPEYLGLGLVNDSTEAVDATIYLVVPPKSSCDWAIAVVASDGSMERLPNRYSTPLHAEFHNVDWVRAYTVARIEQCGGKGEQLTFSPFGVVATVHEPTIEGTYRAIYRAFKNSGYDIVRRSTRTFVITNKTDDRVETQPCNVTSTGAARVQFLKPLANGDTNDAMLGTIEPGAMLGVWIQRTPRANFRSNEQLLLDKKVGYIEPTEEEAELVIDYEPK